MNGSKEAIKTIAATLTTGPLDPNTEVVIGCPATHLEFARSLLPASIAVAGQVSPAHSRIQLPILMAAPCFWLHCRIPIKLLAARSLAKCHRRC